MARVYAFLKILYLTPVIPARY